MFIGVLQLFAYKNENKDFAQHKVMKWWITILVKDHGLKSEIGSIFAWTNSNHEPTEIPRGNYKLIESRIHELPLVLWCYSWNGEVHWLHQFNLEYLQRTEIWGQKVKFKEVMV